MSQKLQVAVAGAHGRMGTVAREALVRRGEYCCGLSRTAEPQSRIFSNLDELLRCSPGVLLDLTTLPGS